MCFRHIAPNCAYWVHKYCLQCYEDPNRARVEEGHDNDDDDGHNNDEDAHAPLQGAPLLEAHQSKEEERAIDRRIENEHLLWIDEPEYHYDVERDVHTFNPRWLRRFRPDKSKLIKHTGTPPPRALGPDEYDGFILPWCCDSEAEDSDYDRRFGDEGLCDSESEASWDSEIEVSDCGNSDFEDMPGVIDHDVGRCDAVMALCESGRHGERT